MSGWFGLLGDLLFNPFIAVFVGLLALLTVFHARKLTVVGIAFPVLSLIFVRQHGDEIAAWLDHFGNPEEYRLLYNVALLLPGFGMLAYYFEHSGFDARLVKYIDSDAKLLIAVCALSAVLDNIAAAMIGGVLIRSRYGKANAPFKMLVGVICASNLGGAPSPIGDTTTVMLFVDGKPVAELLKAAAAAVGALAVIIALSVRHRHLLLPVKEDRPTPVKWSLFWPMLGIPGLLVGNIVLEEPGLGLWAGIAAGCLVGRARFRWSILKPTGGPMASMYFLVILIASAGMIPVEAFRPVMEGLSPTGMAYTLGILSAFFDNIPLTKLAINLGGFDWGLLAYSVGFGGSATWFGSSAGIALGTTYPELYDTKRWIRPFFAVQLAFLAGFVAYALCYFQLVPFAARLWGHLAAAGGAGLAVG
jgi:Na+/H+ antiporter NhaD/arsenite permease-like protein